MTATTTRTALPEREEFCSAMAQLATGVAVITTAGPDGPVGCTANAVLSLSTEPPSVLVSLASTGRTVRHVRDHGGFAVNILSWQQRDLMDRFARLPAAERFADVDYRDEKGCPALDGTAATVVCRLDQAPTALDHTLLIGRVLWTAQDPSAQALVLYQRHQQAVAL
ncbi:flavin reductase family protein [Streptomyces sp. NPDC054950]|uniref:flavin reductase family protein n=1 Tax=Streptomyces sp. NBC_00723 TaxID=2903673 RepID=UPI0006CD0D98|nr:flavin reductase domain protein FMN-binding protein [Actinobacteria bacterium OV320]